MTRPESAATALLASDPLRLGDPRVATLATVPVMHVPPEPTIIVVAHPDDEVPSTAVLIDRRVSRGVDVAVVSVTDGEAAHDIGAPAQKRVAHVRRSEQHHPLLLPGIESQTTDLMSVEPILGATEPAPFRWSHEYYTVPADR